ncbi:MAG: hypothetical protein NT049_02220 [Planctomycetota bacterium]|nr:hypothetical protein [Planctomycetota bacterium]
MKQISPWFVVAAGICLVDLGMTIPIWAGDSPGKIEFTETEVVKPPAGCAVAVRVNGEGWLFRTPPRKVIASADNSNYVYVRQEGENAFVVTANATWPVKGATFVHFASGFSPDGKRLAYLELAEKPKRGWILGDPPPYRLYVNGAQVASIQKWEPLSVYYSADGKRLAFVEQIESGVIEAFKRSVGVRAVVDGKPGPQFEDISGFSFSSPGKRYAYLAKTANGELRVVVDGKQEDEPLTELYAGVVFSKDEQHFAYSGKNAKGENHVFVDGKSAKRLGNQPLGLQYDPEDRLSFVARVNGRSLLVRGDSGSEFTFKVPATHETGCRSSILFSPDGKRLGFIAVLKQYGGLSPVIDGREYSYSGTQCLTFSEDSRHFGFLTVSKKLVINGVAADLPEMPVEGSTIRFDTKGGFDVLVYKDDSIVRLSGKCPDPPAPIEMKPVEIKPGDLEAVEPVRTVRPGRR